MQRIFQHPTVLYIASCPNKVPSFCHGAQLGMVFTRRGSQSQFAAYKRRCGRQSDEYRVVAIRRSYRPTRQESAEEREEEEEGKEKGKEETPQGWQKEETWSA